MKEILAEIIGITLGDGELFDYPRCQRLRIYCNIKESDYLNEIEKIIRTFFRKKPYTYHQPYKGESYIEIYKKNLNILLEMASGDKIRNKAKIPSWIFKNKKYLKACLRGLFDTDDCCYFTGKKYQIINFRSANPHLLKDISKGLKILGYNPYIMNRKVELGRQKEVTNFLKEIKPRNKKHYRYINAGVANLVKAAV